jgi:hypothetical protein
VRSGSAGRPAGFDYDPRVGDETYRFLLRMPQALREELRAGAQASGRSLNAEIVARLAETTALRSTSRVRPRAAAAVIAASVLCAAVVGGAVGSRVAGHSAAAGDGTAAVAQPGLKRQLVLEPLIRG